MEKLDENKDGCITFDEFETAMEDHVIESKFKENKNQNLWQSLVGGRRKSLSKEPEPVIDRKIYCAYTFSNIEKVECVNLPESDHDSPWKDSIFVIYIKKIEDPLVIVCLKPLQCDAWLDAFHKCLPAKSQDKKVQNANLIRAFSTIDWGDDDSDDDP